MYYIFKVIDENDIDRGFGFLTDETVNEQSKDNAVAVLEELPETPESLAGKIKALTQLDDGSFDWIEKTE